MRTSRKRLSLTDRLCEYGSYLQYSSVTMSKSEKRKRMESFLRIALDKELTERQKDCVRYYYFEQMHVDDIAEILGLKPTTIYKHLRLAKKALKKCAVYL